MSWECQFAIFPTSCKHRRAATYSNSRHLEEILSENFEIRVICSLNSGSLSGDICSVVFVTVMRARSEATFIKSCEELYVEARCKNALMCFHCCSRGLSTLDWICLLSLLQIFSGRSWWRGWTCRSISYSMNFCSEWITWQEVMILRENQRNMP